MSARSIRRAQERKTVKDARKLRLNSTAANAAPVPEPASVPSEIDYPQSSFDRTMSELADLAKAEEEMAHICMPQSAQPSDPQPDPQFKVDPAQRQPSDPRRGGPKTAEGKAVSCLNAVKTALTGRTVLLPGDDADAYRHHIAQYFKEWKPGSAREEALAQSLADTDWRIDRLPGLEYALFALGYVQFAELFPGEAPAIRKLMIEAHTLVSFEKQFRNLHIQEGRLRRQRERDQAELRQLKKERHDQERLDLECAAKLYLRAKQDRKPFIPADHGFEFSTVDIEHFLEGARAKRIYDRDLRNQPSNPKTSQQRAAHAA